MRKLKFSPGVRSLALSLIALLLPVGAFGHSLYIQSGRHFVSSGKGTPLFFCYGHHIPVDDPVRREKLAWVKVFPPDGTSREIALRDGKSLHSYVILYEIPGTWVLAAETTPGFFTMWYDQKNRKRHSIKPMSTVADKASKVETSVRSSQWTKTYVTCERPSAKFPAHIGLPLEIVPARDVYGLKLNDKLEFQAYMDGKPYTGDGFYDATYNGFSPHAEDLYIPRTPVTGGKFEVDLAAAGRWYIRFFTKTDPPENLRSEFLKEKRTSTLVFELPGERKRPKADDH
ncbi:MAG: hypothetical protein CSB33_05115 [Desulfobacterales bacterium]|nr:MAG: hypothetical protein CSB33_05115 [Desulfobacterales bacterium]